MTRRPGQKIGPWTVESDTVAYDNPWIRVNDCRVMRPDGAPGVYGVVHFKNLAVGVLPLHDDGTVPLVGQHRFPFDSYSWELPEGGGARDIAPIVSAQRELVEETGLTAQHWAPLVEFDLSNSVTDEKSVCFLAWGLSEGAADPDGDEILAHKRVSFSALHEMVLNGDISDSLTIIMVLKARALAEAGRLPEAAARHLRGDGR